MREEIKLFEEQKVRTIWDEQTEEWCFSVVDIIAVLTESINPRDYWFKMKKRVKSEDGIQLSTNCRQLKLTSTDGKKYMTDVANVQGIFRIIQSIPSRKAEPFKQWMSKVAKERLDQMQDPELSIEQAMTDYKRLGYSDSWINQRLKSIEIRKDLTNEWKRLGLQEGVEHEDVAKRGGNIAKKARLNLEAETGKKVVSPRNARNILSIESNKEKDND